MISTCNDGESHQDWREKAQPKFHLQQGLRGDVHDAVGAAWNSDDAGRA